MAKETVTEGTDQATGAVQADAVTTPTPTEPGNAQDVQAGAPDTEGTATDGDESLITDERFEELQDDPATLRKELQAAFTQKTQKLSEARKLYDYVNKDPDAAIRAMAQVRGISLAEAKKEVQQGAASPETPTPEDTLRVALSNALGQEDAERVLPAMKSLVDAGVAPFRVASERAQAVAAAAESEAALEQFGETYPEWKQHEKAMEQLARHIEPHGLSRVQYLEILLHSVTHGKSVGAEVDKIIGKMQKSAAAGADAAVQGGPSQQMPASTAGKRLTLDEAGDMALRGELREE